MAKIAPKGSKVTGTKKKDKITWVSSKAWKKALTVNAGSGNDVINFKKSKYKNKLNGQAGNDTIYGGTKNDIIHGNAGADKLYGYNGADKIYGDASNDKIYGGNGNDTLYAGKGNDYVDGGANNDKIYGNYGSNTLKGGAGNDTITGGTGKDKIYGGAGDDKLYGGAGNDSIWSGTGFDTINAGAGSNKIYIGKNDGGCYILSGGGNDTISFTGYSDFRDFNASSYTGATDAYIYTSTCNAYIDRHFENGSVKALEVNGKTKNLIISPVTDNAEIWGDATDNIIFVNSLDSNVYAGAGDDVINVQKTVNDMYLHQGDDVINLRSSDVSITNLYLTEGEGNTTITGIQNLGQRGLLDSNVYYYDINIVALNDEDAYNPGYFLRTIEDTDVNYILSEKVNNDLVIHCTNGEKLTVTNYYEAVAKRERLKLFTGDETIFIDDLLTETTPPVLVQHGSSEWIDHIPGEYNGYVIKTTDVNAMSPNHSIEEFVEKAKIFMAGDGTHSVTLDKGVDFGGFNQISLNGPNTQTATILGGDNNRIRINGGNAVVNIQNASTGNTVNVISTNATVTTTGNNNAQNEITVNSANATINSGASDTMMLTGSATVNMSGDYSEKTLYLEGENTAVTLNGMDDVFVVDVNMEQDGNFYSYAYQHYYKEVNADETPDSIEIFALETNGKRAELNQSVTVNGTWYANYVSGEYEFDLNDLALNISLNGGECYLPETYQYFDMSHTSFGRYITLTEESLTTKGLLDFTSKVFVAGTNDGDNYSDYNFGDGFACTICDEGSSVNMDFLTINKGSADLGFFFDVEWDESTEDYVMGSNLYIFAKDHNTLYGEISDFESYFRQGADTSGIDNFIRIRNAFGSGKIEFIEVNNDKSEQTGYETAVALCLDYDSLNTIKSEMAAWLGETDYTSVIEALENEQDANTITQIYTAYNNANITWTPEF